MQRRSRIKARRVPPCLSQAFFLPGAGADLLGLLWRWPDLQIPQPGSVSSAALPFSETLLDQTPSPERAGAFEALGGEERDDAQSFLSGFLPPFHLALGAHVPKECSPAVASEPCRCFTVPHPSWFLLPRSTCCLAGLQGWREVLIGARLIHGAQGRGVLSE